MILSKTLVCQVLSGIENSVPLKSVLLLHNIEKCKLDTDRNVLILKVLSDSMI